MDIHEILPSLQSAPSSSTISTVNTGLKLKSKDTIRGHTNYSLSCYRILAWQGNSSQNQHGVIISAAFPQILNPLWHVKVETIICKIVHHSLPLWPYLPTIYQALFRYQNFLCNELAEKHYTSSKGYRGPPQLLTWAVRFFMIIKWNLYTMAPLWNSFFSSVQGNYFSFRCQSVVLRQIYPPSTRRTNWWRL